MKPIILITLLALIVLIISLVNLSSAISIELNDENSKLYKINKLIDSSLDKKLNKSNNNE